MKRCFAKLDELIELKYREKESIYRLRKANEHRRWTEEEEKELREQYERGKSITNIAKDSKRTIGAIITRLNKLGHLNGEIRYRIHKRVCQGCKRSLTFQELSWLDRKNENELCYDCYFKKINK